MTDEAGNPAAFAELADEELAKQAQAGDDRALHELHRRYYDGMLALARRWLQDETRAQDAVQDAFTVAFSSIRKFKGRSRFATWLFRLARNRLVDHARQAARERSRGVPVSPEQADRDGVLTAKSAEDLFSERQAYLEVVALIQSLEPDEAQALTLRFVAGLSLAETAQVLKISEAAAGMRISRGRQQLKALLGRSPDGTL